MASLYELKHSPEVYQKVVDNVVRMAFEDTEAPTNEGLNGPEEARKWLLDKSCSPEAESNAETLNRAVNDIIDKKSSSNEETDKNRG